MAGAEKPLNAFETLTLAPIDRRLIERRAAHAGRDRLARRYHARVANDARAAASTPTPAPGSPPPPARSGSIEPASRALLDPTPKRRAPQRRAARRRWRLLRAADRDDRGRARSRSTSWCRRCPGWWRSSPTDPASVQLTVSLYHPRPRRGAAGARPAVRPLRPPAGACSPGSRSRPSPAPRRSSPPASRSLIVARVAQALGASTGIVHRPRHHPRSLRARARRLHDRAGHHRSMVLDADVRAADRRRARHAVRLGIDLHVLRRAQRRGASLWAVVALPETRRVLRRRRASAGTFAPTSRRLRQARVLRLRAVRAGSARRRSSLSRRRAARGRHHAGTHLGRIRPLVRLPSIGFMAGNFAVSRLTAALRHRCADLVGHRAHHRRLPDHAAVFVAFPGCGSVTHLRSAVHHRLRQRHCAAELRSPARSASVRRSAGTASGMTGFIADGARRRRSRSSPASIDRRLHRRAHADDSGSCWSTALQRGLADRSCCWCGPALGDAHRLRAR